VSDLKIKGEVGSAEWWDNARDLREHYVDVIEGLELDGDKGDTYRKWLNDLRQLDAMIGKANGVLDTGNSGSDMGEWYRQITTKAMEALSHLTEIKSLESKPIVVDAEVVDADTE
jgi:hypothetical protein